jgi:hypothetical protein
MLMRKVKIIEKETQNEIAFTLAPETFKDSQILQSMYQTNQNVFDIMNTDKEIIMKSELVSLPENLYPEMLPEEQLEDIVIKFH